ncbi:MAG TPA: adenylate/guanylate cyclase domain-containing protein [Gaiellaceae bacterium]|nr:adenylate/guanylate cyclase domain-containing protein [Gaiellaceae bacterium]
MAPETRYAKSGDVHIAYQVIGHGPVDLVFVPGWITHVELGWDDPLEAAFRRRLATFSRLILFDKRGTGLSDRVPVDQLPILEERMDDVRAVMDAAGSERAALLGVSEGGAMSALFAATHPERTAALVLYGSFARAGAALLGHDELDARLRELEQDWPDAIDPSVAVPSLAADESYRRTWRTFMRHAASPGAALALLRMNSQIDVRDVLPTISAPTLVLYRRDARFGHGAAAWRKAGEDPITPREEAEYLAEHIPAARLVELPGADHLPWVGEPDALLGEVEELLTGVRTAPEPDRVLATILFTDIVGSTALAARLGDRGWRELLERHHGLVRRQLERFRGHEVDTAGDGFVASFDGPARGIRCAAAIAESVSALGLSIRAGLHTGECEVADGKLAGIAVHIAARIAALAGADEVLVSHTVKDLVIGSRVAFAERGAHELKGVPGEWSLFAVDSMAEL